MQTSSTMANFHQAGFDGIHFPPDRRDAEVARPANRGLLERLTDFGPDPFARLLEATRGHLESLRTTVAPVAGSVGGWASSTIEILRRPHGFNLVVDPRPIWIYLSVSLVFSMGFLLSLTLLLAKSSGPPEPHRLQEAVTYSALDETQDLVRALPPKLPYHPTDVGVVTEICFLTTRISALTGRAPGAFSLYDFVDASAGMSGRSLSERLCGACLQSEASHAAIRERMSIGAGARVSDMAWDAMEVEERLQTAERASVLLGDPTSAALYEDLFLKGKDKEGYHETKQRIHLLCSGFWG